jgi:hypothetical protein
MPRCLDIYTVGRSTTRPSLRKVPPQVLASIAARVSSLGTPSRVFA